MDSPSEKMTEMKICWQDDVKVLICYNLVLETSLVVAEVIAVRGKQNHYQSLYLTKYNQSLAELEDM